MPSGPLDVLRAHPVFRTYWLGQAVSVVGMWMQQVAQAWVIVTLTDSTSAIARVTFFASLPMLLLGMPGGVLADRRDRRRILIVTQLLFAAFAFAFAAFYASGRLTIGWLYALTIGHACVIAFDFAAVQAFVPELVPPAAIGEAVALSSALFHGARILGPLLAGVVMAWFSPTAAFVANGLSYFAVIYSLLIIRVPARERHVRPGAVTARAALAYARRQPVVRALLAYSALSVTLVMPLVVVFIGIYVKGTLRGDERALALVMAASGAGALAGALTLLRVPAALRGPALVAAASGSALLLLLTAVSPSVAVAAVVQVGLSFFVALGQGLGMTIVQVIVPDELRGRIGALLGLLFTGLLPTASLGLGALADQIGLRATLALCACAFGLLAVPWLLANGFSRRVVHAQVPAEGPAPILHRSARTAARTAGS